MLSTRLASAILVVSLCVVSVASQQQQQLSSKEPPNRWTKIGNDIMLLVRKVDESHPYFVGLRFRQPQNASKSLDTLKKALSEHLNTSDIVRLVLNDQQLVLTDDDVAAFISGDRIEVWSNSSGPATRAATVASFSCGQNRHRSCGGNADDSSADQAGPKRKGHHGGRKDGREGRGGRGGRGGPGGPGGRDGRDDEEEDREGKRDRRRDGKGPHGRRDRVGRDEEDY